MMCSKYINRFVKMLNQIIIILLFKDYKIITPARKVKILNQLIKSIKYKIIKLITRRTIL